MNATRADGKKPKGYVVSIMDASGKLKDRVPAQRVNNQGTATFVLPAGEHPDLAKDKQPIFVHVTERHRSFQSHRGRAVRGGHCGDRDGQRVTRSDAKFVEAVTYWHRVSTSLPTPDPTIDELLRTAIERRHIIRLRYGNGERIVEPHDYGIQNGSPKLLAYQIGGYSSGPLPNWRWMNVDMISGVQLLDRTFPGGRPIPSGKHHKWDQLYIRVRTADAPDHRA